MHLSLRKASAEKTSGKKRSDDDGKHRDPFRAEVHRQATVDCHFHYLTNAQTCPSPEGLAKSYRRSTSRWLKTSIFYLSQRSTQQMCISHWKILMEYELQRWNFPRICQKSKTTYSHEKIYIFNRKILIYAARHINLKGYKPNNFNFLNIALLKSSSQ